MFKILPVVYRDRGFMNQPFAFGGEEGPGTPFEDLPDDWHCPRCRQPKDRFNAA